MTAAKSVKKRSSSSTGLRIYVIAWFVIFVILALENHWLNDMPEKSLLARFGPKDFNLSPEPGRPLSILLGWTGFGLMLLTNPYIIRKHVGFLKKLGKLPGWLNFHIFCGLTGPTLILFHTNFKVGGLVAISFWSMVVSVTSGVIGRYFYLQLLRSKTELVRQIQVSDEEFVALQKSAPEPLPPEKLQAIRERFLYLVGGRDLVEGKILSLPVVLMHSMAGDIRLAVHGRHDAHGLPAGSRRLLKEYAIGKRRMSYYDPFQRVMGYWHSFHLPFAIFMYVVAVIHIVAVYLFRVT